MKCSQTDKVPTEKHHTATLESESEVKDKRPMRMSLSRSQQPNKSNWTTVRPRLSPSLKTPSTRYITASQLA